MQNNSQTEKKYIGIDIGGTKCSVILGTESAEILDKISFPTETPQGVDYTLARLIESVHKILKTNTLNNEDIEAIGVSCGGPLDSRKGIILSPPNLPGWDHIKIKEIIESEFHIRTAVQNDANACALAEWKWGAGKNSRNMVFLTFGTGMGAGIIVNNHLYTGENDNAGEIGHVRLAPDGPVGYNKAGSFEGFCSGNGIKQLAQAKAIEKLEAGESVSFCSSLSELDSISARDVAEMAKTGDSLSKEVFRISAGYLGRGLSILIDILNPERIIIGSIFQRSEELFRDVMEEIIKAEALQNARRVCKIVPAGLGDSIGDFASLGVALNEAAKNQKVLTKRISTKI